jgi:tripartite-type tricarboxylate transporter receptor subunit TctC
MLLAPKGSPAAIVALLQQQSQRALADPKLRALFAAQGVEASPTQDVEAFLARERANYGRAVHELGITMEQ